MSRRHAALLAGGLVIAVGVFTGCSQSSPPVPSVDVSKVDKAVANLIAQQQTRVKEQPRSAEEWGKFGSILWAYGFLPEAAAALSEAERLDPANPRWPYFHALLLLADDPSQTIVLLGRAVSLCGNDPEAPRLRLALFLAEAGQWEEAEKEARQLLAAKPDFAPALLFTARSADARGQTDDAIALARRCTESPFTARAATVFLASLLNRQGDTNAAAALMRGLPRLAPDEVVPDPFQAEAAMLRADSRALSEQAHPLLAAGRIPQAEALIQKLAERFPELPETWLLAGRLRLIKKDFSQAEEYLLRHVSMDLQSSQGWFQLGSAQLAQNRFADAAHAFAQAVALKPDFGAACYNRGLALLRSGAGQEAVASFQEAARLNPERIDPYLMLTDIALRKGDQAEAAKWLVPAEILNPLHPGVRQMRERMSRGQ